jgi:hypothetical protein
LRKTHEELGGLYIIDVASLDETLAWAKRIPVPKGEIEVRPIWVRPIWPMED